MYIGKTILWGLAVTTLIVSGCGALSSGGSGDCPGCSASSSDNTGETGNATVPGPHVFSPPAGGEATDTLDNAVTEGTPSPNDSSAADSSASDSTTDEPDDEELSDDTGDSSEGPDDTPIDTGPEQPTPVDPPTLDPGTPPVLDPLVDSALLDPSFLDDLLALWADGLILDLLGPSGAPDDFTYLELLCRDLDLPESYCRRLYGAP